jgi:hypothetical protein
MRKGNLRKKKKELMWPFGDFSPQGENLNFNPNFYIVIANNNLKDCLFWKSFNLKENFKKW